MNKSILSEIRKIESQISSKEGKKIVLSFHVEEDAQKIYQQLINTNEMKKIGESFPNFNNGQTEESVDYLLDIAKKKYSKDFDSMGWKMIAGRLITMIHGGLT